MDSNDEEKAEEKPKPQEIPQGNMTHKKYKEAGVELPEVQASPEPKKRVVCKIANTANSPGHARSMSTGRVADKMLVLCANKEGKTRFQSIAESIQRMLMRRSIQSVTR